MKICLKCNIEYLLDEFVQISKTKYSIWCTNCYIETYGSSYKELIIPPQPIIKEKKYNKNYKKKKYWTNIDYYTKEVKELTEHNKHNIKDIDKRNFYTYHIDHKISIKHGFENSIPPQLIAHPTNLHILERKQNIIKNISNIIDEDNRWILDGR
jgi:transcription elongation factor Elf1